DLVARLAGLRDLLAVFLAHGVRLVGAPPVGRASPGEVGALLVEACLDALAGELELLPHPGALRPLPVVEIRRVDLRARRQVEEARFLRAVAPELDAGLVRREPRRERLSAEVGIEPRALEVLE